MVSALPVLTPLREPGAAVEAAPPSERTLQLSLHAQAMLRARAIPEAWVWETIDTPDVTEHSTDRRVHHWRCLAAAGGKWLHVVAAPRGIIITAYLDHRARKRFAPEAP